MKNTITLPEIARRTRLDIRKLRYVVDHGLVTVGKTFVSGRGNAREFNPTMAFIIALVAAALEGGMRRRALIPYLNAIKSVNNKYGRLYRDSSPTDPKVVYLLDFADQANLRERQINAENEPEAGNWIQMETDAPLAEGYVPMVVLTINVTELQKRLWKTTVS
jgi:hypothetical protein